MQCQERRLLVLMGGSGEALLFFPGDGQGGGGVGRSGNTIVLSLSKNKF
jgi:hypothetical protein